MLSSLRLRLLVAMLMLMVIVMGIALALTTSTSTQQFSNYIEDTEATERDRVVDVVEAFYNKQGNWENAEDIVYQLAQVTGNTIALLDTEGNMIAASEENLSPQALDASDAGVTVDMWIISNDILQQYNDAIPTDGNILSEREAQIGTVYLDPIANPTEEFTASFLRSLPSIVFLIGLIVIGLILTVSHQLVRPIEELTHAVRAVEQGDLHQQVMVRGNDEVGKLAHAFNGLTGSLLRVEQLRKNMVTDVAHELRNPISNLLGYSEALQDGYLDADAAVIDSIHEEVSLLATLVDDLQELALAEAGQLYMNPQMLEIKPLIQRTVAAFKPQIMDKNLQVTINASSALPPAYADRDLIVRVARNLIKNAIKYTPEHGTITIGIHFSNRHHCIEIQDTGIGIAEQHLQNIFERFYRVDASRTRYTGGVGLGLAIAKQLIQAHGGTIRATSVLGRGSTFEFTLPLPSS